MSGRYSRRKGADFERWLANTLKLLWPDACRGIGRARSGGEVCDVEGTPYWVEAKRGKVTNIQGAVTQAREATDGRPLLIVTRRDREPVLVTMELPEFLGLCAYGGRFDAGEGIGEVNVYVQKLEEDNGDADGAVTGRIELPFSPKG